MRLGNWSQEPSLAPLPQGSSKLDVQNPSGPGWMAPEWRGTVCYSLWDWGFGLPEQETDKENWGQSGNWV